jgi:hypothetical protein
VVLVQRKGRQPRRRESYFEEAGRAVSENLEANLFFMSSIEDATKENDEFWRDIASDLVEFHGVGAKGELNHNYGLHLSEQTKKLISDHHKIAFAGENNPNFGKPSSEETKRRSRESNIGKHSDPRNSFTGRHHTEQSKRKIRATNVGKYISDKTRRKIGLASKGRIPWNKGKKCSPLPEEQRKKISKALKGRINAWNKGVPRPDELKKRQSNSMKGEKNPMYGKHHSEKTKKKISETKKASYKRIRSLST